jgi:hypothetical protein
MSAIFYSPVRNELRSTRTCTSSSKINYFFLTVPSSAPCGTRAAAPELCAAPSLLPPLPFFLPVATLALRSGASGRGSASWRRGAASYRLPPKLADGGAAGAPGEGDGDEGEEDVRCLRRPLSSCSPIPLAPSGARPSASSPFSRADADGRRTEVAGRRGSPWTPPASSSRRTGKRAAVAAGRRPGEARQLLPGTSRDTSRAGRERCCCLRRNEGRTCRPQARRRIELEA